jgi:hypothetical protein
MKVVVVVMKVENSATEIAVTVMNGEELTEEVVAEVVEAIVAVVVEPGDQAVEADQEVVDHAKNRTELTGREAVKKLTFAPLFSKGTKIG